MLPGYMQRDIRSMDILPLMENQMQKNGNGNWGHGVGGQH